MSTPVHWNEQAMPLGIGLDQLLYQVRRTDDGLLFDSVTMAELTDGEQLIALDALVTPYAKLERKVRQLQQVMARAVQGLSVEAAQVSDPFKQNGTANVVALFELSDGQTVSVYFHNPDATPGKILPTDELISWKWLLNKKDITIVVAPERGSDLAIREVGRRIMKLAAKNSAAFARVNARRAERLQNIASLRGEVEGLERELDGLTREIEVARLEAEERNLKAVEDGQQNSVEKGMAALNSVRQFLSRGQFRAIADAMKGEEGRFFIDKAKVLAQLIEGMAKTYEQDGKGDDATAYLHYFKGSGDWYITEKDASGKGTEQAFGLADLGQGGELGYISIDELVRNNVELDLHFQPKTLAALKPAEPETPAVSVDAQRLADGKAMLESVATEFDGSVSPWEPASEGTVGLWEYANLGIGKAVLRVGVSGGGVVSIDGKPHDPDGVVNDNPESVRKSIASALPAQAAPLDPTSAEGYALVLADEALQLAHQDQLDSFFQGRIIAVRNALRDMGWEGERFGDISKNGIKLKMHLKQVGAGKNLVGADYSLAGVPGFFMSDTLTRTPQELAQHIDMGLPATNEPGPAESDADLSRSLMEKGAAENRDWAKNREDDPAGGAGIIQTWDSAKADALMAESRRDAADKTHESVARDYIADHLQGRMVRTKIGDCAITSTSRGKLAVSAGRKGGLKLAVIARVPEVLIDGGVGELEPLHKARTDGMDGFYPFTHVLDMGETRVEARIKVGHRQAAVPLVYSLDVSAISLDSTNKEGPTFARRCTGVSAVVDMGSSEASELILDAAPPEVNPADDDGWNIQILHVWNKEGVELDPETLEPLPATSQPGLSQFPVVGSDPIWGDIIEVPTVYGDKTRVARAQLEDSSRNVLAQYTKAGKRKPGYGINRGNLLIGGAELADFARLEKEMRESGQWEVARYPRSPEQQIKLLGQGYTGYLKDERTGEMIPSPLGLVWAKPIAQAVEAPEDGAQTVEAVCRWLASLGWTVSQPDERGDVVASLDGMDVSLGASPTGQLDYDGEPLDTQLSAKEAAYLIHGEYRYGDEEENRRRLGINDPDADDPDSDEWKTDAFTKSALIVKDTVERLGGRVSFGDFSSSISGGLFDSVAAVPYGICAQIGAAGKGVGRAAIEEDGKALIYVGLSGEEVITVGGVPSAPDASHAAIIGMVEALLARQAPERPASENGEKPSAEDDMSRARAETETSPTDEQKESGNYQKGEINLFGLDIAIENPQGSTRSGKSKDGAEWSNTMQADYGFIRNTLGADGDEVDVFVGPDLQSETAFVISQIGKEGEFDEYKTLLGFTSEADARSAYLSSYGPGWDGLGSIRAMSIDEFKAWLGSEAPRTAPAPAAPRQETDMQPVQPPQESTVKGDDRSFLESIINNTVADILAPELGDQIGTVYERNAEDAEMLSLIEQAVMAYQRAMEQATASL